MKIRKLLEEAFNYCFTLGGTSIKYYVETIKNTYMASFGSVLPLLWTSFYTAFLLFLGLIWALICLVSLTVLLIPICFISLCCSMYLHLQKFIVSRASKETLFSVISICVASMTYMIIYMSTLNANATTHLAMTEVSQLDTIQMLPDTLLFEIKDTVDTVKHEHHVSKKERDFNILAKAIILVESSDNDLAKSTTSSAAGLMQQLKSNVDDANRIASLNNTGEHFTYDDRFNRSKSIRIFKIIQNHYNKEHSVTKALRIHRGFYSSEYNTKVLHIYDSLKNV